MYKPVEDDHGMYYVVDENGKKFKDWNGRPLEFDEYVDAKDWSQIRNEIDKII